MTPDQLRAWQTRMQYSPEQAADELGVSRATYFNYLNGRSPIKRYIKLACIALEAGLTTLATR